MSGIRFHNVINGILCITLPGKSSPTFTDAHAKRNKSAQVH